MTDDCGGRCRTASHSNSAKLNTQRSMMSTPLGLTWANGTHDFASRLCEISIMTHPTSGSVPRRIDWLFGNVHSLSLSLRGRKGRPRCVFSGFVGGFGVVFLCTLTASTAFFAAAAAPLYFSGSTLILLTFITSFPRQFLAARCGKHTRIPSPVMSDL